MPRERGQVSAPNARPTPRNTTGVLPSTPPGGRRPPLERPPLEQSPRMIYHIKGLEQYFTWRGIPEDDAKEMTHDLVVKAGWRCDPAASANEQVEVLAAEVRTAVAQSRLAQRGLLLVPGEPPRQAPPAAWSDPELPDEAKGRDLFGVHSMADLADAMESVTEESIGNLLDDLAEREGIKGINPPDEWSMEPLRAGLAELTLRDWHLLETATAGKFKPVSFAPVYCDLIGANHFNEDAIVVGHCRRDGDELMKVHTAGSDFAVTGIARGEGQDNLRLIGKLI